MLAGRCPVAAATRSCAPAPVRRPRAAAPPRVRIPGLDQGIDFGNGYFLYSFPDSFLSRTVELGDYYGIRRDGQLIAMAGERLHLDGWTEISAVCTAPAYRCQGIATRLLRIVLAGVKRRSERASLHTGTSNTTAIQLYESFGFRVRRRLTITVLLQQAPGIATEPNLSKRRPSRG
jgi:ribosomal protein S18 acetylase RimI-like enzyme